MRGLYALATPRAPYGPYAAAPLAYVPVRGLSRAPMPAPPYGPYFYAVPASLRGVVEPGRRVRVLADGRIRRNVLQQEARFGVDQEHLLHPQTHRHQQRGVHAPQPLCHQRQF